MIDYNQILSDKFKRLKINLVKHDTSSCGLPCFIEVELGHMPKDKGDIVLDLGNYIYRKFGLAYQNCPEYRGRGEATTLRWFMSWENIRPIQKAICLHYDKKVLAPDWLPIEFYSLALQSGEVQQVAIWKKTGQLVIYTQRTTGSEIQFEAGKKKFMYLQAELGPVSDFEILGDL